MRIRLAAALAVAVAGTAACDNPVVHTEEHEPVAVSIRDGTTEIAYADASGFTGEIIVGPGNQSQLLTVVFLDEEGDPLDPGGEHSLVVVPEDAGVATWVPTSSGAFSGRVQGGAVAAQTMFAFQWIHGTPASGHAEGEFDVRVTVSP